MQLIIFKTSWIDHIFIKHSVKQFLKNFATLKQNF